MRKCVEVTHGGYLKGDQLWRLGWDWGICGVRNWAWWRSRGSLGEEPGENQEGNCGHYREWVGEVSVSFKSLLSVGLCSGWRRTSQRRLITWGNYVIKRMIRCWSVFDDFSNQRRMISFEEFSTSAEVLNSLKIELLKECQSVVVYQQILLLINQPNH